MQVGPGPGYGQPYQPNVYVNPQNQTQYAPEGFQYVQQKPQYGQQQLSQYPSPYGQHYAQQYAQAGQQYAQQHAPAPTAPPQPSSPPPPPQQQHQPGQIGQPPPEQEYKPPPGQPTGQFEGPPLPATFVQYGLPILETAFINQKHQFIEANRWRDMYYNIYEHFNVAGFERKVLASIDCSDRPLILKKCWYTLAVFFLMELPFSYMLKKEAPKRQFVIVKTIQCAPFVVMPMSVMQPMMFMMQPIMTAIRPVPSVRAVPTLGSQQQQTTTSVNA
ncbi:LOW QUALITY PROTEIN: hypothetical protein RvY_00724 [Ramazzottius varieornatus]|uniref:Uncharacterized protein n=1 Tax=Ramazzottius varieornatus TaxID=947166 RepID=A0A1D1UDS3_RAMVA|nr:LOW QUALITY PROTEIN: hypothetical protein RvY_00724 [Ramazzottius varieornatus]